MNGDDDDAALFRRAVGKVRRLDVDTVEPVRGRRPLPPRRTGQDGEAPRWLGSGEPATAGDADEAQGTDYHRSGLQHGVLRKLRRGGFPLTGEIDLHGMTAAAAAPALAGFLAHACRERMTCVRVITGKGLSSPGMKPVLRPRVAAWLRSDERVLAFTAAPRHDGGTGALYVLLRSRR